MKPIRMLLCVLAVLSAGAGAQSVKELNPASSLSPQRSAASPAIAPASRTRAVPAALTQADVDAYLDGYMPYALQTGDIAGAVVVVVKDGKILTQRGFGYADVKAHRPVDPATTLFRPGSTSKLFTWTSVMQLVQAGKIDLDRDVNDYLDFRIPPAFGKPITMRNLMTHTAGFEETAKYLIGFDPRKSKALGATLKRYVPPRIYAPGAMPSYSNYGATLAGYIVQRVSGEPFAAYVQRHIFAPLGMTHATFVQPLPGPLAASMSRGYNQASLPAEKFELVDMAPAGGLSASGGDMARFMIAHLANGGPLLDARTTRIMHTTVDTPISGLPGMALGFYHEDRNGMTIIGHAGDLNFFHSDLHLYLDKGVGLFMSFNSAGKAGSAHVVREHLFDDFTNRYFPATATALPTLSTAKDHGALMVGHYVSSRGSQTTFLRLLSLLGQANVSQNDNDTISVSALVDGAGNPKRWREVRPFQWVEVNGSDLLGAVVENGRVVRFAPAGFAPIIEFLPAPAAFDAGWILPVASVALAIVVLSALAWPIVALVRRRYHHKTGVTGRPLLLHRGSRATAWIIALVAVGWFGIVGVLSSDASAFDGRLDVWMRLLQLGLLLAIVGAALTIWNTFARVSRPGRHRLSSAWEIALAGSAVFLIWLALDVRLLTPSLNF